MRPTIAVLALALVALGCEAPDPERDGFLVVDEAARAAGIEVEVSGERHSGELPVAVPEGAEAAVVRAAGREPIEVGPGELIEVVGPDGATRRGAVPRDSIWLAGDAASVSAFAEMIGARATPLPSGGWAVEGPNAFVLAAMVGTGPGVGVTSMLPPPPRADVVEVGLFLDRATPTGEDAPALDGPVPEAAALVGLYVHGDVSLLLDAAGGWSLFTTDPDHPLRAGTYRPRPGGVDFIPNDGGPVAVMERTGDALVDDLGVTFDP